MPSTAPRVDVFVAVAPFDMHRSTDGLAGEVRRVLLDQTTPGRRAYPPIPEVH
jgi:hypothetical protein